MSIEKLSKRLLELESKAAADKAKYEKLLAEKQIEQAAAKVDLDNTLKADNSKEYAHSKAKLMEIDAEIEFCENKLAESSESRIFEPGEIKAALNDLGTEIINMDKNTIAAIIEPLKKIYAACDKNRLERDKARNLATSWRQHLPVSERNQNVLYDDFRFTAISNAVGKVLESAENFITGDKAN